MSPYAQTQGIYRHVSSWPHGQLTEDIEGDIVMLDNPPIPSLADMQSAAAADYVGRTMQRPPAYSALNVGGQRAYDLARRGQDVQLEPRPIDVYRCEVTRYDYPEFELEITCGGGTYVRSLGRDLAESLGTGAVMSALTRTAIGEFKLEAAVEPDQLTKVNWAEHLLPMAAAVSDLPQIVVSDEQATRLRHGLVVDIVLPQMSFDEAATVDGRGELVAIVQARGTASIKAVKNF